MDQSAMKNICSEMIHELEESRRTIGCPSSVGCFKGKEIDNYIKGPLASKLNDSRETFDSILKKIDDLTLKIEPSIVASKKAESAVNDMKKIVWGLFTSLFLMVAATVWGNLAKLGQDYKNQIETASYLKELSYSMTSLERKFEKIPENNHH